MRAANSQPGSFSGVWHIFLYNWPFYAAALILDLFTVLLLMRFRPHAGIRLTIYLIAAVATSWAVSSLLVSHYIYDRSCLSQWSWLATVLEERPRSWANIHAGLDQTSASLMRLFPCAQRRILDIYVPSEMSEPSIGRARHLQPAIASEKANPAALPLEDCECDAVFLIFVAHELRRREARLRLFHEINRGLKPGGRVVLVEHLRNWNNFLAYGPGVLHFFSAQEWVAVSTQAGFDVIDALGITPFVRCFVLAKRTAFEDHPDVESAPCD